MIYHFETSDFITFYYELFATKASLSVHCQIARQYLKIEEIFSDLNSNIAV